MAEEREVSSTNDRKCGREDCREEKKSGEAIQPDSRLATQRAHGGGGPASPGLHLGLRCCCCGGCCCFLGGAGRRPMRREAELWWGAALGQVRLRVRVLPLGLLLLLLLEAGQAEEEAEDGFQIPIPDLCVSGRRTGGYDRQRTSPNF